ncbi:LPXTG-motif cell wall anchor domain-containing protein/conserved repeat domain-containing protein [Micromonospora citrea]|uniref:LPXTG-motif cell wall anchor domain-containing protein/conserved repeat domain-containing protein n=1 Tax=Micromonospora citrea TaxID=47855 RepID=A0A1C6VRB2_9ACTN|nr:LPXTG cell wall anchor domain-containing protein [Micromonospora citrea]SCL68654.1 LPXTG-motif cell wall anchor domain-containing protein/conserved repeat domain-containing protein [Micromonospora citrea]
MSRTSTRRRWGGAYARLAALALLAGALLLAGGSPASAASTININPGNVPTTAANFTQDCDPNLGGGPFANEDVWVFNLPGNQDTTGVFQTITATFSTPTGDVTRTIPGPDSAIVNNLGTSKAWIRVPAGWTLTGATAVISGTADFFVLTHTCAASNPRVNPKLHLTKTGSPATGVKAGDVVTYTYTVTNQSTGTTDPITNITVTDNVVTGITCEDTSLAQGESTTCTGTYTVKSSDVKNGKIVNTAQASGLFLQQTVPSNQATFTVTTKPAPPKQVSLSIDKKARVDSDCRDKCANDGYAAKGDKIFYTYRVTNTGTVTITDVGVDDPKAGEVVCNSTTLARGTSTDCHAVEPYVVTKADVKAGKVVNTARATGRYDGRSVVSDPDTVTVCIRGGKYDHRHDGKHDKDGKHHKELPVTGDDSSVALSLGGGLLAAGGLLIGASRIRRKAGVQA